MGLTGLALLFAWVGGLYAAYGIAFVIFVTVVVIAEITSLEFEKGSAATWTLLLAALVVAIMERAHLSWGGILAALPGVALFVIAYFAIGACWSVVKWYFFTRMLREAYDAARKKVILEKGIAAGRDKVLVVRQLRENLHYTYRYGSDLIIPPDPSQHTSRILTWIGHWPFSLLWTLINDPVRRMVKAIYQRLKNVYRAIGKRAFAGVEDE